MHKIIEIFNDYRSVFESEPEFYFSPGRVNLIGEHIDYLGGRVFPTAIHLGIYAAVAKRDDDQFCFRSLNFPELQPIVISSKELAYDAKRGWTNYPIGMIDAFVSHGMKLSHGLDVVVYGDLPNGSGLSSSAAMEVLMGIILEDQYDYPIPRFELVQMAKQVENEYVGVNCGIMDQFAVGMSKENHAIFLDTNTLNYELVPLQLEHHVLLIANSNVKRGLVDSKYNERRQECELGLATAKKFFPTITELCQLTMEQFDTIATSFSTETIKKRVRHAISENKRTQDARRALEANNLSIFGSILNEGHASLRDDFEVSTKELDSLQSSLITHGAKGARLTGAGFGGCVIAIVETELLDQVIMQVTNDYNNQTDNHVDMYICKTSNGAHKLNKEEIL